MPGYVDGDMHEYQHKNPTIPQHAQKNEKNHIMGSKLSGKQMRATYLHYHLKTENIYKRW